MNLQVGAKLLIQNENEEYLFLKRAGKYEMTAGGQESWDVPGGRIDPAETVQTALYREVEEETGLVLDGEPRLLEAQDIFIEKKDLHVVRLTYQQTVRHLGEIALSDEHTAFRWVSLENSIYLEIEPYLRTVLDNLEKNKYA